MAQTLAELLAAKKASIDASKRPNSKKLPMGRSRIRVLPSWRAGDLQFWHDYGQHFIKDSLGDMKAVYICSERTFGRPCEVCAAISVAGKSVTNDALLQTITEAKASGRVLINALHIDGPTPTVPEVFEIPPTVFEQIVGLGDLYIKDDIDVFSLDGGFDLSVERVGSGLSTKYTVLTVPKSTTVSPDVMKKVQDLDKYVMQENEQNRVRAITEVRSVAGLLGNSPVGAPLLSQTTANLLDVDEDLTLQIPVGTVVEQIGASAKPAVVDVEFTETATASVAKVVETAQAEVAKVTEAVATVTAPTATGDEAIDKLLAELNG